MNQSENFLCLPMYSSLTLNSKDWQSSWEIGSKLYNEISTFYQVRLY